MLRWTRFAGVVRAADTAAGWALLWAVARAGLPGLAPGAVALGAGVGIVVLALVPLVRHRFRPVSGVVALSVSRELRPGATAWLVRPGGAERVLVTGRRRLRLVISALGEDAGAEGIAVRRTRALLLPD